MNGASRSDRVRNLASLVAQLALLGSAVLVVVVLITQGVNQAGTWTTVIGGYLAIAGPLISLGRWRRKQRAAAGEPARTSQVAQVAQELAAAVREQWRREAEVRSLGDPDPMPVRWRLSDPTVMDHGERIAPAPIALSGRSDQIPVLAEQFRHLHRRRLVIVGGPGTGKTTLAMQLLLRLLDIWQPGEPVPVLFSLASWDPQHQPRVQDWLARQLIQTYPDLRAFGADAVHKLADQGRLLPVLDGLDEIPPHRRGEVINRLNASLLPDTGLIMTSRTTEYAEAVHTREMLSAAAVIEPMPLTASEAAAYLKDLLPRQPDESWLAVLAALRNDTAGPLTEVVASPLGLWLLRMVYIEGHRDPKPLIDPGYYADPTAIQHHLHEELIPAAVHSRPPLSGGQDPLRPRRHHDPDQVRRWLTTLAVELRDAKTRDWRWWQLADQTLTNRQLGVPLGLLFGLVLSLVFALHGPGAGLVSGLGVGLPVGLGSGLFGMEFGLAFGVTFGLVGVVVGWVHGLMIGLGGLVVGLASGVLGGLVIGFAGGHRDAPAYIDLRMHGRVRVLCRKLAVGLLGGLFGGLLAGLWSGLRAGLAVGLRHGLLIGLGGLLAGLAFGLISFAASPSIVARASSPTESYRADRALTILASSVLGLVAGVAFGVTAGPVAGLLFGLVTGLVIAPVVTNTRWSTFAVAALWLGARGRLPLSLMVFLEDAYRLGLLRIVGPVYQFRHAALQDHLAPPGETAPATASADLSTITG
ncbi:MAG TPA: NACHT domain-containing protein [Pseudonocardiaceae bacterium]|nr:NACHT domain-containing protein [Pseudonocardiaceae bacterium]